MKHSSLYIIGIGALLTIALIGGNYANYLVATILIYTLVGMSLRILVGFSGQVSIGHAGFWAIGAYTSGLMVTRLGLPFVVGIFFGGVFAALLGVIVALPALRIQGHYLGIVTLAFALFVQQILLEWESLTGGHQGLYVPRPEIAGFSLSTDLYYNLFLIPLVLLFGWIMENFRKSLTGHSIMALRMSSIAAQTAGIGRAQHLFVAFMMSAFYSGVSGALFAHLIGYLSTETFGLGTSLSFLTMIVIGGLSSVAGPILGAIYLTMIPEVLREMKGAQMVLYGISLILCMQFLPGGLASIFERVSSIWKSQTR
jgi:branched-chain amino acid transport system permease protein